LYLLMTSLAKENALIFRYKKIIFSKHIFEQS
jgi:hypothetical protein